MREFYVEANITGLFHCISVKSPKDYSTLSPKAKFEKEREAGERER